MIKITVFFFSALFTLLASELQASDSSRNMMQGDVKVGGEVGDQAPDFLVQRMDGSNFALSSFRKKKAVNLIFWATWCPNCKAEIPAIKAMFTSYPDEIEVLAINVESSDSLNRIIHYQNKHRLNYPVAFDADRRIATAFGVLGIPTQIIIDVDGIVRYRGATSPGDIDTHLHRLTKR